jgi:hypothetical protein
VKYAIGYLVGGILMLLYSFMKLAIARRKVKNGTAEPKHFKKLEVVRNFGVVWFMLFVIATWPLGLAVILENDKDDDGPQSKVPPKYR